MFDSIFYNGEEYKQIWLDGVLVWEKDDGSIVYPYDDCDTYYTFYRYDRYDDKTITFEIIDETLPYSVNGVETNTYTYTTNDNTVKLINLKPYRPFQNYYYYYDGSTRYNYYTTNMYQMRLPNLTDLSYLFYQAWNKDGLKTNYDKSNNWQLEYIEWHPRPTNMSYFLCDCSGMTNTHLEKLLPYFPNTKYVKNMSYMFSQCGKLTSMDFLLDWEVENVEDMSYMFEMNYSDGCSFTEIDLSNFRTHNLTNMRYMFYNCKSCKVFDLRNFDTRNVTDYAWMFSNVSDATIYISDKWTLGTSATFGNGTNLTFVLVDIEHPITSIDLKCDFDANNVTQQILTIEPTIYPKNWSVGDLEVIYDTTYLRSDNDRTFYLKDGCQGKTFDITYRSKTDNSISKTVTINVNIPNNVLLYPYPEADSAFTVRNTSSSSSSSVSFSVIDSSLPYSINGAVGKSSCSIPASSETVVRLVNLKPNSSTFSSSIFPTKIEQLRIPNVTNLSYLFRYFGYDANYEYSWSPQYFEFSDSVTNMDYMFYYCRYLTDELMEQFIPYFPNASNVTTMYYMFYNCITLTKLDLSTLNVSSVLKSMGYMFQYCSALKELNLSSFDTTNIPSEGISSGSSIFSEVKDCTIYVNENKWTLGTDSSLRKGTNLTFVVVDDNGEIVPRPTGLLADFTTSGVLQFPVWMDEVAKDANYYFKHGTYKNDSTVYGLVENTYSSSYTYKYWTCYKVVAPSNTMKITFRAYTSSSSYPFTIHLTSDATQPSYSSSTNRLISAYGSTYRDTDGIVETEVVAGETYYIHFQHYRYYSSSYNYGACIRSIEFLPPIESIDLSYDVDLDNIEQSTFTVSPIIEPTNYNVKDLEIIYDSNYMSVNPTTFEITLKDGSQGMSHTVTYRSKADNSISKSFTFYVNADLEIEEITLIDFTQSTAPMLPNYMTVDYNGTYSFSHGLYTTDVYGLIPNNKGKNSSTAYTRYKYVAPTSGDLTFTYRCSSESNYDFFTIHVDTSTSQPSYTVTTNQVVSTSGTTYASTDGTASVSVVEGTTYYIHIQYYKDSSSNSGYDMGCIRKIELK